MKTIIKNLLFLPLLFFLGFEAMAYTKADCLKENDLSSYALPPLGTIFSNYKTYSNYIKNEGVYLLCFKNYKEDITKQYSISATEPLTVLGLNLTLSLNFNLSGPFITISTSNVSLQDAMLSGNGTGTAIQVTGGGATIGHNVSLANFATGVYIAKDASAVVTQGKFTSVTEPIAHEIPAFAGMTISADWLGKHVSDTDATKVDRIAGKLDLTECNGSVEMYLKEFFDPAIPYPLQYHATCPVAELKDKPLKLTAADKSEKEIAVGACYFDCDKMDVLKDNYVSFLYSSSIGQTAEFIPLPAVKISDLADVINVPGLPIYTPTTSGMTVETTGPTDPANFDPSNPKGQTSTTDGSDSDDDGGGQVGQGASNSCGANLSASAPNAGGLIVQIMLLFGGLPVIISKRKK